MSVSGEFDPTQNAANIVWGLFVEHKNGGGAPPPESFPVIPKGSVLECVFSQAPGDEQRFVVKDYEAMAGCFNGDRHNIFDIIDWQLVPVAEE